MCVCINRKIYRYIIISIIAQYYHHFIYRYINVKYFQTIFEEIKTILIYIFNHLFMKSEDKYVFLNMFFSLKKGDRNIDAK